MIKNYDVAIIGAGPGGYVAAIRCAQLGLNTVCIDKRQELGGTCLNVGCIPSKALLQSSEYYYTASKKFKKLGIDGAFSCNFPQMMQRKTEVIKAFNQGISGLFKKNKVTFISGEASFLDPHTLQVGQEQIRASYIILATGSEPTPLPFLPFDEKKVLSSTGALNLPSPPKKLLIVGAGVIGVELGSVYSRLHSEVVFVEFLPQICPAFDELISKELLSTLESQGMQFMLSTKVVSGKVTAEGVTLETDKGPLSADAVLVCIGRRPYTHNLGLEKAGLKTTDKGFLEIDTSFRTLASHIFAIGDIVDGPMLAHKASEEGIAVAELIGKKKPIVDYMAIPNVIYTHPEVAYVGLTEAAAKTLFSSLKVGLFPFKANSRAKCAEEEEGFVKIVADAKTEKILGVHILSAHASELIALAAVAIRKRLTLTDLIHTPFAHPTLAESIKEAALAAQGHAIHK